MRLGLLGGFDLRVNGAHVRLPIGSQRLLAFLSLHRQPLQRVFVAGMLWIDANEERANASLRTTLWRLRQPECNLVSTTTTHVRLNLEVRTDVSEMDAVANRVLREGEVDPDELERLGAAGDVLPDSYDDWVIVERERFRQVRLHALEAACEALAEAGEFHAAINAGLAAVDGEPLRESAHRAVIRAHLAEGNYYEAIRQYRLFRRLLADKLGLQPSPEMRRLVESLPTGDVQALRTGVGMA